MECHGRGMVWHGMVGVGYGMAWAWHGRGMAWYAHVCVLMLLFLDKVFYI